MSDFDLTAYRAEIAKLKEMVREMDMACGELMFECGPNGISLSAITRLQEFLDAHKAATQKQGDVAKFIISEMARQE